MTDQYGELVRDRGRSDIALNPLKLANGQLGGLTGSSPRTTSYPLHCGVGISYYAMLLPGMDRSIGCTLCYEDVNSNVHEACEELDVR